MNRYSYCLNNPLAYVDPTGQWGWSNFKKFVCDHAKEIAIAAVVVVAVAVTVGVAAPGIAAAAYSVVGAVTGAAGTAATAVVGAATAAVGAGVTAANGVLNAVAGAVNTVVNAATGLSEAAPALSEAEGGAAEVVLNDIAAGGEMLGGGESTALSCFRFSQAGEVFAHYSTMENAESLISKGLLPGSYATTEFGLTGSQAVNGLNLLHYVDALYSVSPYAGTALNVNPVVVGGEFPEICFLFGTGPGTVTGPWPIAP